MNRMAQKAALITTIGLLTAAAAMAGVPNAGQSNLNNGCSLVGGCTQEGVLLLGGLNGSGAVDALSEKQVLVKDAGGNTVTNSVVIINFSNCYTGGDIRIANTQPFAGLTVNCGAHTVSATTNASGIAVFRISGYSNITSTSPIPPGAGEGCATVTADGVPLGSYSVATPDLRGATGVGTDLGVNGGDTVIYTSNRFGGAAAYRPRANFARASGTQAIDGGDTVIYTKFRFSTGGSTGSTTNGATPCP